MRIKLALLGFLIAGFIVLKHSEVEAQQIDSLITVVNTRYAIAQQLYNQGTIDSAFNQLESIILTRKLFYAVPEIQRAEICRLATLSAFYLKQPEKADKYLKQMLAYQPNYVSTSLDDLELMREKLAQLYVLPKLSLGVSMGSGFSIPTVNSYSSCLILSGIEPETNYLSSSSNRLSVLAEFMFNKHLSIETHLSYATVAYNYERLLSPYTNDYSLDYAYWQKMDYFEIPLSFKYYFRPERPYKPFISVGGFYQFLLSGNKNVDGTNSQVTELLNHQNFGWLAGAGVNYYRKRFRFGITAEYFSNIQTTINPNNRLILDGQNDRFLFEEADLTDDFNLQKIIVSLSLAYYINYNVFDRK